MSKIIPVFYTIDESYVPLAAVSIKSLIENASPEYKYEIFVVSEGLEEDSVSKLGALATKNAKISFRGVKQSLEMIPQKYLLNMSYFTLTIYFRLFLATMFPEIEKGIYLDADTIVNGDIAELFETDLEDNCIAAIPDPTVYNSKILGDYVEDVVGVDKFSYVNSGVMLLDFKRLREIEFEKKVLDILTRYEFDTVAPDQDYLNALLKDKVLKLEHTWNTMPGSNGPEVPKLVHYNLFSKPWHYQGVEYEEMFWEMAEKTEFYAEIRAVAASYTDENRAVDAHNLEAMMVKAEEIMESSAPKFRTVLMPRSDTLSSMFKDSEEVFSGAVA